MTTQPTDDFPVTPELCQLWRKALHAPNETDIEEIAVKRTLYSLSSEQRRKFERLMKKGEEEQAFQFVARITEPAQQELANLMALVALELQAEERKKKTNE
jgi:hypothetical protein